MKKSFAILAVLVLSQAALAETKYVQRHANRPSIIDQVGAKKGDRTKEGIIGQRAEYKLNQQAIKLAPPVKEAWTKEQMAEISGLKEKYAYLVKERSFEDANYVAKLLLEKYGVKVDPYVAEAGLSEEDMKIIAEYQAKYNEVYYSNPKQALGYANIVLKEFNYKLVPPARNERDIASEAKTELIKSDRIDLQRTNR